MELNLLRGLLDNCTAESRKETLQYFEHLKENPDGWKLCATEFTNQIHRNGHIQFFCLQVVEHHVRHRHGSSSDEDILALRKVLLTWLQSHHHQQGLELESFVRNKMAQIYALVFVVDYPFKWPSFFNNVLASVQSEVTTSVDLYLRILLAIDCEVVDRQIIHSQEENVRNTTIKDHMRKECVPQLVQSWLQIMARFEGVDCPVVCVAMEVVGLYVSWIDISLIANESFISLLLKYLSNPDLRESAADCLHEIIGKGMDPVAKTKLIESLYEVLKSASFLVLEKGKDDEDDADFQVKLSRLVNGMGCGLISSWNKLVKADDPHKEVVIRAIDTKLPFLHRYLSDEDDGVSEAIIPFAVQYVGMLKTTTDLTESHRRNLQSLLDAVILKLRYDQTYDFDNEGEEELMFMDFRKELKVLFDNIAHVDCNVVYQTCQSWLSSVLSDLSGQPFTNVELVLRLVYLLGESLTDKQYGAVNIPDSPWHQLMCTVVQSQVCIYPHSVVLLQYYEVVVRYEKFFTVETSYIAPVMESFLGEKGLRHPSSSLRSRLSYLLVRFIKGIKGYVGVFSEQILENLRELLLMLPGCANYKVYLSTNDMNFLYEVAGILIVQSNQPPEGKKKLMKSMLSPILDLFKVVLSQLVGSTEVKEQEQSGQALYGLLSHASRITKVFTNHQQVVQSGCLDCFSVPLAMFLQALEVNVQRDLLHSGVRQYLHRMIICLGDELLNYVPLAVSLLLKDCKAQDIQEFIPLINQLIVKYKERILPVLEKIFVPVCSGIIACLSLPYDQDDTEEQRDRHSLQKAYFLFISSVVTNNVSIILAKQGTEKVQEILNVLIQHAVNYPDPAVQKICFNVLRKLIDSWGDDKTVNGFVEYMYSQILPACFIAPLRQEFDLNDGQSYLVLGEVASILKSMQTKRGEELSPYLEKYLSSVQVSPELSKELIISIWKSDAKVLKGILKSLFLQWRTA